LGNLFADVSKVTISVAARGGDGRRAGWNLIAKAGGGVATFSDSAPKDSGAATRLKVGREADGGDVGLAMRWHRMRRTKLVFGTRAGEAAAAWC